MSDEGPTETSRLHKSNCPSVLPRCTCDDPDHPFALVPQRILTHLLDEADPDTIATLHDEIADILRRRLRAALHPGESK